ncbi:MAG: RNA polymerase sigma factor [Gammaproteobacteria bacterium]
MIKGMAAEWIETHREELLRFLRQRLNCRETALDVVQDCFMRLAGNMESNTLANPRVFLFRIAANRKLPAELPPIRREVFLLRNIQHRSHAEITQQTWQKC